MFFWNTDAFESFFAPMRARNALLDALFYDEGALTAEELHELYAHPHREGSILVVSPKNSKNVKRIRPYKTVLEFMQAEGEYVTAIVVPGVGSSAVGAAALARNVANRYQIEVVGIVTGYGMGDLLTEVLGGWAFYGYKDWAHYEFGKFFEQMHKNLSDPDILKSIVSNKEYKIPKIDLPMQQDAETLLEILAQQPQKLKLLLGHSKGSLLIDFVLEKIALEQKKYSYCEDLTVVTLGTVVDLPEKFKKKFQFIGSLDWFGGMNSRLSIPRIYVPGVWHHLNTKLDFHMSVEKVLEEIVI
ncbi:MAG: hypothetical protein H7832_14715 [Magnetococcus sp. DMHC-6]